MPITVQAFLSDLSDKYSHVFANTAVLSWINEVESNVCTDVSNAYANIFYRRQKEASKLLLPTGIAFEDIRNVRVDGIPYKKYDIRSNKVNRSYWFEDGRLNLYPSPDVDDTVYNSNGTNVMFGSSYIWVLNTDFTRYFAADDLVQISGCLTGVENNKAAKILRILPSMLIFDAGTFSDHMETAVIIETVKIKVTYEAQPTKKLISNIATDTLLLPDKFMDLYTLYCISKICLFGKEFAEYGNWQKLYNQRLSDYQTWYEENKPMSPESSILADGGNWGVTSRNFDTE